MMHQCLRAPPCNVTALMPVLTATVHKWQIVVITVAAVIMVVAITAVTEKAAVPAAKA